MTNLGNDLYSGASSAGKIWTLIIAIISTIISLIMIALGVYIIYHKNHLKSIDGKVLKSSYNCIAGPSRATSSVPSPPSMSCKFDARYEVDNQNYTKTFSSLNSYAIDDKVTVWYDPNHPDRSEFDPPSKSVGWVIIGISLFILLSAWFIYWLSRRNKFISASIGAGAGISIVKSMF
jgi:hypothetical protein